MDSKKFKPKSFHLQWHITEKCNLKCTHCYYNAEMQKKELNLKKLKELLEEYIKLTERWGFKKKDSRISITGGEPLTRKDFYPFLKFVEKNSDYYNYSLMSNATLINKKTAEKLAKHNLTNIQVSLDGMQKTNDEIRGKKSFEKAVKGIDCLTEAGLSVGISMTVTKKNLKDVPKLIDFCKEKGIDGFGLRRFVPIGRGKKMKKEMLNPMAAKKLYEWAVKENRERKGMPFISLGCEDGILAQNPHYTPAGCTAGYCSLTILANGDVFACRRLPIKLGSTIKEGLREIYYNSREIKKIRNLNNSNENCEKCPFLIECRAGAKCIAFGYFGNAFAGDPQCWWQWEKLSKKTPKTKINKKTRLNQKFIEVIA